MYSLNCDDNARTVVLNDLSKVTSKVNSLMMMMLMMTIAFIHIVILLFFDFSYSISVASSSPSSPSSSALSYKAYLFIGNLTCYQSICNKQYITFVRL